MDALGILPANGLADCYLSVSDSRVFGRADGPFRAHNCRDGGRRGSKRFRNRQRGLCPGHVRGVPQGPGHGRSRLAPAVRERRGRGAPAGGDQWIQGRREGAMVRRFPQTSAAAVARLPAGASPIRGPAGQARRQHDREPGGPHRHDVPGAPRRRAGGAAPAAQQGTRGRRAHRQDLLYPPDRLLAGPGHQAAPGHGPHPGHAATAAPSRAARGHLRSAWRWTFSGKTAAAGSVVPVIKRADTMDFATFHAAYEALVEKARTNRLMPDDFAGATMSLTNPGGLGTVASVPRLMAGQGSIIAVGAIGYPAEFSGVAEERLAEFGISKVMTITSTYDHRVIQGAESGAFLAAVDHLLQGDQGFYDLVEESLQLSAVSYQLVKATPAAKRRRGAGAGRAGDALSRRGGDGAGQGVPHARPPGRAPRSARHRRPSAIPRSIPARSGSRPRSWPRSRRRCCGSRSRAHAGRVAAVPAGHLLRHDGVRDRAHLHPRRAGLAPREDRVRRLSPADAPRPSSSGCSSGSPRWRRSSGSSTRPISATSASRSKAWTCWCRCSTSRSSAPPIRAPARW